MSVRQLEFLAHVVSLGYWVSVEQSAKDSVGRQVPKQAQKAVRLAEPGGFLEGRHEDPFAICGSFLELLICS